MPLQNRESFTRSNLFGGKGKVEIWNLLGNLGAPPFRAVLWCELEAGGSVGLHRQQHDPEIIICISGTGEAVAANQQHPLEPGKMVYLPHGAALSLRNSSSEENLQYLIIKAKSPKPIQPKTT